MRGRLANTEPGYDGTGNILLNRLYGAVIHDIPWDEDRNARLRRIVDDLINFPISLNDCGCNFILQIQQIGFDSLKRFIELATTEIRSGYSFQLVFEKQPALAANDHEAL